MTHLRISIVVPVYDEVGNVALLESAVAAQFMTLAFDYELIFVDDGSSDGSREVLRALQARNPKVRIVALSRNFGHQAALAAGLDHASGDAVITMDADLQHPPELIPRMLEHWQAGSRIVSTIRTDTEDASLWKKYSSGAFYAILNRISATRMEPNAADFRLLDRAVVEVLKAMPERARFWRGLVSWVGFPSVAVEYAAPRRHSGRSKYSLSKMAGLALDGILNFSSQPLRFATYLGLLSAAMGVPYAAWAVYAKLFTESTVSGWASIVTILLFQGGVQLFCLGIVGEYLGRVYDEVKQRPLYIAQEKVGFEPVAETSSGPQSGAPTLPFPQARRIA